MKQEVAAVPVVAVPGVVVPVAPPVVADPVGPGFATAITPEGIGPFAAGLENSVGAIGRRVPGLRVVSQKDSSESHDIDKITVSRADAPVLTLIMNNYRGADPLFTVAARDPLFRTATGVGVGSTVQELAARHAGVACSYEEYDATLDVLGVERRLYCRAADLANISFELDAATWKPHPGEVTPAELAERPITEVVWRAPNA